MALMPLWSEATPYSSSCAQAFAFSSAKAVIPTTARTVAGDSIAGLITLTAFSSNLL